MREAEKDRDIYGGQSGDEAPSDPGSARASCCHVNHNLLDELEYRVLIATGAPTSLAKIPVASCHRREITMRLVSLLLVQSPLLIQSTYWLSEEMVLSSKNHRMLCSCQLSTKGTSRYDDRTWAPRIPLDLASSSVGVLTSAAKRRKR